MVKGVALVWTIVLACGSSDPMESIQAYISLAASAQACTSSEACVMVYGPSCTCPMSVNANREAEIKEAATSLDCRGLAVQCAGAVENPQPQCRDSVCSKE